MTPGLTKYFLSYQVAWIRDQSRLRICEKGRQIGMSYADSYDSVTKAALKDGRDVWVMSRDEQQAKQYILYCKRWANVLKLAAGDLGEQVFKDSRGDAVTIHTVSFASGYTIYALSSNPDAIVGKTGHVKLDEFALHKDQRQLYAVAKPVTQWGGTLSIMSTHRGVLTVFNQIIKDIKPPAPNKMGWSLHTIPIQLAVHAGLVEKIDEATRGALTSEFSDSLSAGGEGRGEVAPRSASGSLSLGRGQGEGVPVPVSLRARWLDRIHSECLDEEQWQQEYCCVPADESSAFITYDMIAGCEDPALRLLNITQLEEYCLAHSNAALYLGVDVARKVDLCVFDVGEKLGDVVHDRLRDEKLGKTFAEIRLDLYRLLRLPQIKRCSIDATGLGMQLAEEARASFGWKVEPVTFTAPVKEELAFGLRADFEDKKLRLVRDDKLRADLRGIKKETTIAGNLRFVGESEDSHCDRFWAKALRQSAQRNKGGVWAMVG